MSRFLENIARPMQRPEKGPPGKPIYAYGALQASTAEDALGQAAVLSSALDNRDLENAKAAAQEIFSLYS